MAYSLVGILTGAISVGEGRHAAALRVSDFGLAMFLTMIGMGMGVLSFTLAKAAVVILLINVLRPPPWQSRVLWGWILGNGIFMVAASAVYFLQCSPPQALWKTEIRGECRDPWVVNYLIITGSGKLQSLLVAPQAALTSTEIWSTSV
jgi:hypothetical protein